MGNSINSKIGKIFSLAKKLPVFSFDEFAGIERDKNYLKTLFSRYEKANKLIRLKKGLYTTKDYVDELEKRGGLSFFSEFVANIFCSPSYLSLEYVLYQNNVLTEVPKNFTSVSMNKTAFFSNKFGNYFYHKIKKDLFCGFEVIKEGNFTVLRASKAKALFDYIYFRKNDLSEKESLKELRLNLEPFSLKERKEVERYSKIEGSKKMNFIFENLWN